MAEYKQIDTNIVEEVTTVVDTDDDGNVVGQHEETITKEVPVMGMVYRDMTAEEEAEQLRLQAEMPAPMPTTDERIAELEAQNEMLTECLIELADIIYA